MVRVKREKMQSERKKDKRFEGEGGNASLAKGGRGQIEQWRYTS